MKKDKNNKGLIVLVIALIIIILGLIGYIVYDKVLMKDDTKKENTTTTTNDEKQKKEQKYIYETKINYKLSSNINYEIKYKYYYEDYIYEKKLNEDEIKKAKENDSYIYSSLYVDIYINDNKINNESNLVYRCITTNNKSEKINIAKNDANNNNIFSLKDIINTEKNYFVLKLNYSTNFSAGGIYLIIINENLSLLKTINFTEGQTINILQNEVTTNLYKDNKFYIDNDKLYYLTVSNCESEENMTIDENVLTINNDLVSTKINANYKGNIAGAC